MPIAINTLFYVNFSIDLNYPCARTINPMCSLDELVIATHESRKARTGPVCKHTEYGNQMFDSEILSLGHYRKLKNGVTSRKFRQRNRKIIHVNGRARFL